MGRAVEHSNLSRINRESDFHKESQRNIREVEAAMSQKPREQEIPVDHNKCDREFREESDWKTDPLDLEAGGSWHFSRNVFITVAGVGSLTAVVWKC